MIKKRNKKKRRRLNYKGIIRESCKKKIFQLEENNKHILLLIQEFKSQNLQDFNKFKICQPLKMK